MENISESSNLTDYRCAMSSSRGKAYICIISEFAPMTVWFDRYVTIFWYCVGITGNSLTIKIWSRRVSRLNISALYLIVLAFTDLFYLFLHVIQELKFAWGVPSIDIAGWCQVYFVFYMFAMYMSPFLILGFTIERFLSIKSPFKSQRFSVTNRGPLEISGITMLALLLAIPQMFSWEIIQGECQGPHHDFYAVWSWISDSLVFVIFPVTSLVLNSLVMKAASKADKKRQSTLPLNRRKSTPEKSAHHNKTKHSPSTLTLLCVSFYRIITVIPVTIAFALQGEFKPGSLELSLSEIKNDDVWSDHFVWYRAKKAVDEIGLSQYSCNIFIYLITATHFRHEMKRLFYFVPFMRPDAGFSGSFNRTSIELSFLRNKPKDKVDQL
ncbi:growth hormone secretagogue receptor type 1-like [Saccostrea cucullata]|uniref:growth hormone secretagogue receptor type 1-like n=1 Tax=Saccostrea cuccullata TaxID=36930 RepID=UPI002ED2F919